MRCLIKLPRVMDLKISTIFTPAFKCVPMAVCDISRQVNLISGFISPILEGDECFVLSKKPFKFVDSGKHQLKYGSTFRFKGSIEPFIFGCTGYTSLETFTCYPLTGHDPRFCDVIIVESLDPIEFGV